MLMPTKTYMEGTRSRPSVPSNPSRHSRNFITKGSTNRNGEPAASGSDAVILLSTKRTQHAERRSLRWRRTVANRPASRVRFTGRYLWRVPASCARRLQDLIFPKPLLGTTEQGHLFSKPVYSCFCHVACRGPATTSCSIAAGLTRRRSPRERQRRPGKPIDASIYAENKQQTPAFDQSEPIDDEPVYKHNDVHRPVHPPFHQATKRRPIFSPLLRSTSQDHLACKR